jgi:hypothetical protein
MSSSILRSASAAIFVTWCLTACGTELDPSFDAVDSEDNALAALTPLLWPENKIPVCWENPSIKDESERALVRSAIASTWGALLLKRAGRAICFAVVADRWLERMVMHQHRRHLIRKAQAVSAKVHLRVEVGEGFGGRLKTELRLLGLP